MLCPADDDQVADTMEPLHNAGAELPDQSRRYRSSMKIGVPIRTPMMQNKGP